MRIHTLKSLGEIIRFMQTEAITQYRFKIIALLNTAIANKDLQAIGIHVWDIFLRTVEQETLGTLLGSILVSLKPLLESHREETDKILTFLIIENGSLLSRFIPDLFFIEELPIRKELKACVKQHRAQKLKLPLLERLTDYMQYIQHENITVRTYGLKYLAKLLRANRTELNNLIISEGTCNAIVTGLLKSLISCCKQKDTELQSCAAQCLGELGALDPSNLPPEYEKEQGFAFSVHSDEFCIMALAELCRAYQVQTDTKSVDCFAVAIQMLLVSHSVNPETNSKMNIWEAIPVRLRELMIPLLKSNYSCINTGKVVIAHPVFGSQQANKFEDWAYNWGVKLITSISKPETQQLLRSFKFSIRRDSNTLSIIFPYIILHGILDSGENERQQAFEEFETIFRYVTENKQTTSPVVTTQTDFFSVRQQKPSKSVEKYNGSAQPDLNKLARKCARVAFGLLEFLERWTREYRQKYPKSSEHVDYRIIRSFLGRFDARNLALTSYHCGEYARALYYIELYIEEDTGSRLQNELHTLAKIHSKLFDSDSVVGAMSLKESEPSLEEQIVQYNVTNRLTESAACFERLMQVGKLDSDTMKAIIECYLGLDQPATALLISESFYKRFENQNDEASLRLTSAEPLLHLSRWDDLDKLLEISKIPESKEDWGVNCGKLMLDFRKNKHAEFDNDLESIRITLLKLFKTHESEQSLYQKCYSQVSLMLKNYFFHSMEVISL